MAHYIFYITPGKGSLQINRDCPGMSPKTGLYVLDPDVKYSSGIPGMSWKNKLLRQTGMIQAQVDESIGSIVG
jgi:hypothetical protein